MADEHPMLDEFKQITEQYVADMETAYDAYQQERDEIVQSAVDPLKELNDQYFQQVKDLTSKYLEDIKSLPEGPEVQPLPEGS